MASIKISLVQASPLKTYTVVTEHTSNTGSFVWTVPIHIPNNTYKFHLQSKRGNQKSTSSYGKVISITTKCNPPESPNTKILSPFFGQNLKTGNTMKISWLNCGYDTTDYPFASIGIYPTASRSYGTHLVRNISNNGTYKMKVPGFLPSGEYSLGISPDEFMNSFSYDGWLKKFSIKNPSKGPPGIL